MNIRFCDLDTMIVFAKSSNGELVFIDDVENGYKCDCFCLNCRGKLNAKNNGEIKAHHFAHASGSDCKKGHENTLPLFVQRILNKTKWMLLPKGCVKFDGVYLNDFQPISVSKSELIRVKDYPPILLITTSKEKQIALYIRFTDDYLDRKYVYENDYENLIELDIRNHRGSQQEVEPELESLLTHRSHEMKWIKRYDENKIVAKINEISSRKSFGTDPIYYHEHFYCPQEKEVITSDERSCQNCIYLVKNIIDGSYDNKCIGFIEDLSVESISRASKPDYSNIDGPSYLDLHAAKEGKYYWLFLKDLPKAYPEINYTLIFNDEEVAVFLVSLKAIERGKLIGLEIDTEGNIEYQPKSIHFPSSERHWRICGLANYKIKQEDVDFLSKFIS